MSFSFSLLFSSRTGLVVGCATVALPQEVYPACYIKRTLYDYQTAWKAVGLFPVERWEWTPLFSWLQCLFCLPSTWVYKYKFHQSAAAPPEGQDRGAYCTYAEITALASCYLARKVGLSRLAHNIMPPTVTGPPEFERAFRAHQNCVEFYPIFLVTLWTCGVFFSEVIAAAGGLVYIIARQMYFSGYVKSTKKRLPGFLLTLAVLGTLSLLGSIGLLRGILHKYFDIHL